MENLNTILWVAFGVLSAAEIFIRWVFPAYRRNPANAVMVENIDSFWVAMAVALLLKTVLLQPFTIPSGSMEDTLLTGDYILVKKYEYGYSLLNMSPRFLQFKKPRHGDIVVFVFPKDHSKDFIKRCIGTPGDVIVYKKKELYVNGVKQVEPYVKHIDPNVVPPQDYLNGMRDNFGPVTVESGHYFMMGDNRDDSADSRYWGQVDEKLIKGRAWMIYWHRVGYANFLALLALTTAVVSAILWILGWGAKLFPAGRKQSEAGNPSASVSEGETKKTTAAPRMTPAPGASSAASFRRTALMWMVAASLIAGLMIFVSGYPDFQKGLDGLKARMFKVVDSK
jgi:signal peptidase I